MNRLDRLRALIDDRYAGKQSSFAHEIKRSPAQVNQWLSGVRRLGDGACRVIETAMDLPLGWMDGLGPITDCPAGHISMSNIHSHVVGNSTESFAIKVVNVRASTVSDDCALEYIEDDYIATIIFKENWFTSNCYRANKLVAMKVKGHCMEPTLFVDDLIVVDTDQVFPRDGAVFAVLYEGVFSIRRLVRDVGAWWLESDNLDKRKYPRKACTDESTRLIGRVIYRQSEQI